MNLLANIGRKSIELSQPLIVTKSSFLKTIKLINKCVKKLY